MADTILKGGAKILGGRSPRQGPRGQFSLRPVETDLAAQESPEARKGKILEVVEKTTEHLRDPGTLVAAIGSIARGRDETIKEVRSDPGLSQEGVRMAVKNAKAAVPGQYEKQVFQPFQELGEVAKRLVGGKFPETAETMAVPKNEAERLDLIVEGQIFPLLSSEDQLAQLERWAETGDRLRLRHLTKVFSAKHDGNAPDAGRLERLQSMLVTDAQLAQSLVAEMFATMAVGLETYAGLVFKHGVTDPQADITVRASIGRQALEAAGWNVEASTG